MKQPQRNLSCGCSSAPGLLGTEDARLQHSKACPAFAQAAGVKCETLVKSAGRGREGVGWTEEIGF